MTVSDGLESEGPGQVPSAFPAVVVGAGVAGLECAAELKRHGRDVIVLEKSRGLGGRCATRRVHGQPVDYGLVFLHGSTQEFIERLRSVEGATILDGWPRRIHGSGKPCQPDAFSTGERRLAYSEGLNVFPKHLAKGLEVRRETRVVSVLPNGTLFSVRTEDGDEKVSHDVILALPVEQTLALLEAIPEEPAGLVAARRLLQMVGSLPCLTVLAGYPLEDPEPPWDVDYPEESSVIQMVCHESSKRQEGDTRVLVYQALPGWSRDRLEGPAEGWAKEILQEAARLLGDWAARPAWSRPHRWRYARIDRGNELRRPMLVTFPEGQRLGLVGEMFAPGGGVEAAWLSGRWLARRLLGKESP